jgi:hypothetical protein
LMRPYVIFRMGSSIKKVNGKDGESFPSRLLSLSRPCPICPPHHHYHYHHHRSPQCQTCSDGMQPRTKNSNPKSQIPKYPHSRIRASCCPRAAPSLRLSVPNAPLSPVCVSVAVAASEILHANALFAPVTSMIARSITAAKMSGTERLAACAVEHEYHTHATIANIPSMATHARATTKPEASARSSADVIVGGWIDEGCAVNEAIEGIHTAWAEVLHHYIDTTLSEIDDLDGQGRQQRT